MARLTLTFDNGPEPAVTERALDVLADRRLPATFFMVGDQVTRPGGRRTAERVAAAGHRIGNHTMTHGEPLGRVGDPHVAVEEIRRAEDVLGSLLGEPPLFRPNGGGMLGPHVLQPAAADYLTEHAYTLVTWTCVARDWEEPDGSWVDRAHAALREEEHTVLVLHDHLETMIRHLPRFLDEAVAAGVELTDELPPRCTPIVAGVVQRPLEGELMRRPAIA